LLVLGLQFGARATGVNDRPTILRAGEDLSVKAMAELACLIAKTLLWSSPPPGSPDDMAKIGTS
jgi:hypothetical protein